MQIKYDDDDDDDDDDEDDTSVPAVSCSSDPWDKWGFEPSHFSVTTSLDDQEDNRTLHTKVRLSRLFYWAAKNTMNQVSNVITNQKQEALLIQRNRASTLSVEIV